MFQVSKFCLKKIFIVNNMRNSTKNMKIKISPEELKIILMNNDCILTLVTNSKTFVWNKNENLNGFIEPDTSLFYKNQKENLKQISKIVDNKVKNNNNFDEINSETLTETFQNRSVNVEDLYLNQENNLSLNQENNNFLSINRSINNITNEVANDNVLNSIGIFRFDVERILNAMNNVSLGYIEEKQKPVQEIIRFYNKKNENLSDIKTLNNIFEKNINEQSNNFKKTLRFWENLSSLQVNK